MVESVGQQLQRARLQRKISVEYAAKATRIRPDRIVDLEADDYTNFPNLAYAKGFLIIYAKYLGVDIADFARAFDTGNPVSIEDYEYLSNPPEAPPRAMTYERGGGSESRWGGPGVGTLFVVLLVIVFAGALILYFWVSAQRLGILTQPSPGASPGPSAVASPVAVVSPTESPMPETAGIPMETPATGVEAAPNTDSAQPGVPSGASALQTPEPIASSPPPDAEAHRIEVRPLKKTWLVIRQGSPSAAPVFEDYLYPGAPLQFSGNKFFIQAREENSVEIRKDGQPVPYHPPGITIE